MLFVAASVFFVAGLTYAVWCLTIAIDSGFHFGMLGMAVLSGLLCYQGLTLFQGRHKARVPGIVSAAALAIGCIASAILVTLPWLTGAVEGSIPSILRPTLLLLLSTAAAFAVATALLIYDRPARSKNGGEPTRDR
jgi:hypothetical protein